MAEFFFCAAIASSRARSVVTCDSWIGSEEILIPQCLAFRLTSPVVVQAHNKALLQDRMACGAVLFIQRRALGAHMRSIAHVATQNLVLGPSDRIIRRGNKYAAAVLPALRPDEVPFPVQPMWSPSIAGSPATNPAPVLCFGDRVVRQGPQGGSIVNPLACVIWPVLQNGDTLLVTPQDGDYALMNRQPTLVQESMLGMFAVHLRVKYCGVETHKYTPC
jgi:DNA-directed RNA polymerase beta' subunit